MSDQELAGMSIAARNALLDRLADQDADTDRRAEARAEYRNRDADDYELGRAEDRAVWGGRALGW